MNRSSQVIAGAVLGVVGLIQMVQADVVYLKGKKSVRGVVVDEQADRYILNTSDGEVSVLKALVEGIQYDDPEQSYYQLGLQHQRVGHLREALAAYEKAVELRPDFKAAQDAVFTVRRALSRQDESEVLSEVDRQRLLIEQAGRAPREGRLPAKSPQASVQSFEQRFGCDVRYEGGVTQVATVKFGGPAERSGLLAGDAIVAIANEPIQNLAPDEVSRRLNSSRGEVALTIERDVQLTGPVTVELGYDGPRLSQTGDLLMMVNGRQARYLSQEETQSLMSRGARVRIRRLVAVVGGR